MTKLKSQTNQIQKQTR
jgi:chromosome segregation ATPase